MSKLSMAQAAKMFAVSRPTLAKHIEKGKISAEKTETSWQLDLSELQRVYPYRDAKPAPGEHDDLSERAGDSSKDLQAENNLLRAKLEAAEQLAEERRQHLDDLRKLLPTSGERPARRRWWRF